MKSTPGRPHPLWAECSASWSHSWNHRSSSRSQGDTRLCILQVDPLRVLGAEPAADLLRTTVVACIGPVTAEAATQCNIQTTIIPISYTAPAMVDAIVKYFEDQKSATS